MDIEFVKQLIAALGQTTGVTSTKFSYAAARINYEFSRAGILDTAKSYVTKDRAAADHGDMEDNFPHHCIILERAPWTIDFIEPQDVAVMMTMLKLARIRQPHTHRQLDRRLWVHGLWRRGRE